MAQEIVIVDRHRRLHPQTRLPIGWSVEGIFLYALPDQLVTQGPTGGKVIAPTPRITLPERLGAIGLDVLTEPELQSLDDGERVFEIFNVGLTEAAAADVAQAVAILREQYSLMDPRARYAFQYGFTGRRVNS